jgi:hypothetical protein
MYEHAPDISPYHAEIMNDPANPAGLAAFQRAWLMLSPEYRSAFAAWAGLMPLEYDRSERDLFDPRQALPSHV